MAFVRWANPKPLPLLIALGAIFLSSPAEAAHTQSRLLLATESARPGETVMAAYLLEESRRLRHSERDQLATSKRYYRWRNSMAGAGKIAGHERDDLYLSGHSVSTRSPEARWKSGSGSAGVEGQSRVVGVRNEMHSSFRRCARYAHCRKRNEAFQRSR